MRVLHLATHLNTGGITTYILKLAAPIKQYGVEFVVVSSGGEWKKQFEDQNIPCFDLNIRTKNELHPKLYLAIPRILQILKEQKIELIHAHSRVTQVLAFWVSLISGIPFVTTCHGFYKRRLGRRLLPAWGVRAIAISQAVGDELAHDFHVSKDRIKVINNGVDFNELRKLYSLHKTDEVRRNYGIAPTDFVVGEVARLVEDKGHEYLIRAIHELKPVFPNLKVLIVGEGRQMEYLRVLSRNLNLADDIIFTGNVKDITLPLACMDVFVLPATWREGFGLSIVEAMACKRPIIVTNIWALNSLIQHGVTGLMVEPKQIAPLAAAIRELIVNAEYSKRLALEGNKMAERLFSINRMAEEIAALYQQVTASHSIHQGKRI